MRTAGNRGSKRVRAGSREGHALLSEIAVPLLGPRAQGPPKFRRIHFA